MVHRAPDSRLLTNLIEHEREYAKHLTALSPLSHAALASLSAYAAASPATPITAVVDLLATANDALHRYTTAIDTWRQQLVALKDLEDDLTAVLRDRDILVTRLIKASKSTRDAHRTSRIVSASLSSLTLPSTANSSLSGPASTNPKLAQAQAELKACEAHLVAKERQLDARRISIARDGLGARCRALIDCAWVWAEMGKQGLKALQALDPDPGTATLSVPKPAYASDNSSLTPSQSASQTAARETSNEGPIAKEPESEPSPAKRLSHSNDNGDLTLNPPVLPPAHAISDLAFPTSVRPPPENGDVVRRKRTKRARRPPSQHIAEVSDEGANEPTTSTPFPTHDTSSDDEHPTGPLHVVENDPFAVMRRSMLAPAPPLFTPSAVPPVARASAPDVRTSIVVVDSPSDAVFPAVSQQHPARRQRKTSLAFFGSLRGLFRRPRERGRTAATEWDPSPSSSSSPQGKRTGWVTRTDARIKPTSGAEDSDAEMTHRAMTGVPRGARLRKGRPSVRENGLARAPSQRAGVDGRMTNPLGPGAAIGRSRTRGGTMTRKKKSVADLRGSDQGHTDGEIEGQRSLSLVLDKRIEEQKPVAGASPEQCATVGTGFDTDTGVVSSHRRSATTSDPRSSDTVLAHRRSASESVVDALSASASMSTNTSSTGGSMSRRKPPPRVDAPPPPSAQTQSHDKQHARRNGSAKHVQNQSLMSIVADVARARSLDVSRAPGEGEDDDEGVPRPLKLPLRSALRNASRTPSPTPALVSGVVTKKPEAEERDRAQPLRDSASMSSYETGRESLHGEGALVVPVRSQSQPPVGRIALEAPPPFTVPPPPADPPPQVMVPNGTAVRRKSVRVSLPPTFSPPPRARYDEEADDGYRAGGDVWADSSEEDESYSRARQLLRRGGA